MSLADQNRKVAGGLERLRQAGEAVLDDRFRGAEAEARASGGQERPSSPTRSRLLSTARVTVPGRRGEGEAACASTSCGLHHKGLAVLQGNGGGRQPLDARDVPVVRQPRRLAFGRCALPAGARSSVASGAIADELSMWLLFDGVQTRRGRLTTLAARRPRGQACCWSSCSVLSGSGTLVWVDRLDEPAARALPPARADWAATSSSRPTCASPERRGRARTSARGPRRRARPRRRTSPRKRQPAAPKGLVLADPAAEDDSVEPRRSATAAAATACARPGG